MTGVSFEAATVTTPRGAILFDRSRLPQVDDRLFLPPTDPAERPRGGRGAVWYVDTVAGPAVLRHYRRGGAVARLSRDRYLWLGADRTRSFAEFRLLAALREQGLPVPVPLAARFWRPDPLRYSADLLMLRIPRTRSLAEHLPGILGEPAMMGRLGATLARFHRAGVAHADLNAHNILLDDAARWWVVDLDRGRWRRPDASWWTSKLDRLQRSLRKLGAFEHPAGAKGWNALLEGHRAGVAAA